MTDAANDQLANQLLGQPYDQLNALQKSVIDLMAIQAPTDANELVCPDERSYGERLSDKVAAVGGSWAFIITFGVVLFAWMGLNGVLMPLGVAFDPYPFIFLNLMLSTLAAIQAPIIMMSQNRSAAKDRLAAEHDYRVNLRAELEIMSLHDKIDALREREVVEILKAQSETLELLRAQVAALSGKK